MPNWDEIRRRFGSELDALASQGMKRPEDRESSQDINARFGLDKQIVQPTESPTQRVEPAIQQGYVPGEAPSGAYREMLLQKIREAQEKTARAGLKQQEELLRQQAEEQKGYKKY